MAPPPAYMDARIDARAARLQVGMVDHLTPEGLLAYEHRWPSTGAQRSHDVLRLSDTAIWTGCYAAAQACRWHVTRDPDARAELRALAAGLERLETVTGVPGRLVRSLGRPLPGEVAGEKGGALLQPARDGSGLMLRGDVSRDQLAGVVFGWTCLARFGPPGDLRLRATAALERLALRLRDDGMWLRDPEGRKTRFGELRADVKHLPMVRNGPFAAIGYAPFCAARGVGDPATPGWRAVHEALLRLQRGKWHLALESQQTWLSHLMTNSNSNMVTLGLTAIALTGDASESSKARHGLRQIRRATRGWWNGGICACYLLSGEGHHRQAALDELRACLVRMDTRERPPVGVQTREMGRITRLAERGVTDWHWKANLERVRRCPADAPLSENFTYTRADWLFAYWLARASGHWPRPEDAR